LPGPPQTADFEAVRAAVMRSVPTLPADAIPGKFAICALGEVFSVRTPQHGLEDWMTLPPTAYKERWAPYQAILVGLSNSLRP
jgi:hypothetical protein